MHIMNIMYTVLALPPLKKETLHLFLTSSLICQLYTEDSGGLGGSGGGCSHYLERIWVI